MPRFAVQRYHALQRASVNPASTPGAHPTLRPLDLIQANLASSPHATDVLPVETRHTLSNKDFCHLLVEDQALSEETEEGARPVR